MTEENISADKIHTFQEKVAPLFIVHMKENISSQFAFHDILSTFPIVDPRKVPSADSVQLPTYGKKSVEVLLNHYGKDKPARPSKILSSTTCIACLCKLCSVPYALKGITEHELGRVEY